MRNVLVASFILILIPAFLILIGLFATARAETRNEGEVGIITGMVTGTYAQTAADLTILDDPKAPLRVIPMIGKGSLQNIQDILHLRGVDVAFLQADALPYAKQHGLLTPDEASHVQYISKLYDEEMHVVARDGIDSLAALEGKKVNSDVEGSGSAMTADVVLNAAGVHAQVSHMRQADAVRALQYGQIDAIIHVGGAPIPLLKDIPAGTGLHFVPIDLTPDLAQTYLPSELSHAEYPSLIPDGAKPVPTIAVGDVMAVYAWDPNSERGKKVARFVDAFFENFSELQQPPRHPKWREVNPAATLPGWVRFPEAQAWLDQKVKQDEMSQLAVAKGLPPLTPQQKAALFTEYQAWLKQQQATQPNARR